MFTRFLQRNAQKTAEENHLRCIIFLRKKKETRARDLAYYDTLSLSRKSVRAEGTATRLRRCVVLSSAPRDARWPIATHHPVVPSILFPSVTWPIQDIRLLVFVCSRINHPFITPAHSDHQHYCNTIARLVRRIYPPPRPSLYVLYAIQYW